MTLQEIKMTRKIDSTYTKDTNLIRSYDRKTIHQILISLSISIIVYALYSIVRNDFDWGALIAIIIAEGVAIFGYIDLNKIIDIEWDDKDSFLTLTYYNILDKIVTERIDKKEIKTLKVKERNRRINIELIDNRLIKVNYTKKQSLMILNQRLDMKVN